MKDKPVRGRGPAQASVRSYVTHFRLDENPIAEGGLWINGRKDGVDWIDVITRNGVAYGEVTRPGVHERRIEQGDVVGAGPEGNFDDPTALLTGKWGRNQHGKARVFSRNQTAKYYQEVEIRLRSSIAPHTCTGYEVFWRCLKTGEGYAEIVRWNGKVTDFTSLHKNTGSSYGVAEGDLVEATIIGNVIKGYVNGVEVISATDDTFREGCPGIGFNFGVGTTNIDFGLTSFEIDTWND